MVRLITHNLLACHAKGCTSNNCPLRFKAVVWPALVDAARELRDTSLPAKQPEMVDDGFLKKTHHVLLEVRTVSPFVLHARTDPYVHRASYIHVEDGVLVCANCSHLYPISHGILNMLLAENEIG
ncbi:Trm112p-domain-containing protein [Epithele typhae]|uniref:Trm112p-domain-containing protein n=1 Tax=Epithele typhae TaxID=378194 RepID=UPI00200765E6|nr:Trm112p-domain-containing protein [Epithele typhae]KAH9938762.1 Trm112p-domain-containing protein [Epithele typhae]